MKATSIRAPEAGATEFKPESFALVWIDAGGARVLRWRGRVVETVIDSSIPAREKSTEHVRHDPLVRSGGGGRGNDEVARHRAEHVRQFLALVMAAVNADERIEILGTGTLCEHLATEFHRSDKARHRQREILVDRVMPLTPRQLAAHLKVRLGLAPPRGGIGAYRWTGDLPHSRSGHVTGPRRVVAKDPDKVKTAS